MPTRDFALDPAEVQPFESGLTYWNVLDSISFMVWPKDETELRAALQSAPKGVRLFYLTWIVDGAVEDGGFGAYFGRTRPTWLHEMSKQAILEFKCPAVVKIINEAEQYLARNVSKLRDGMPREEWSKVMGPVVIDKANKNIHRRFFRACHKLHDAREKYLKDHPDHFTKIAAPSR